MVTPFFSVLAASASVVTSIVLMSASFRTECSSLTEPASSPLQFGDDVFYLFGVRTITKTIV